MRLRDLQLITKANGQQLPLILLAVCCIIDLFRWQQNAIVLRANRLFHLQATSVYLSHVIMFG